MAPGQRQNMENKEQSLEGKVEFNKEIDSKKVRKHLLDHLGNLPRGRQYLSWNEKYASKPEDKWNAYDLERQMHSEIKDYFNYLIKRKSLFKPESLRAVYETMGDMIEEGKIIYGGYTPAGKPSAREQEMVKCYSMAGRMDKALRVLEGHLKAQDKRYEDRMKDYNLYRESCRRTSEFRVLVQLEDEAAWFRGDAKDSLKDKKMFEKCIETLKRDMGNIKLEGIEDE